VIFKPSPVDVQDIYLKSLGCIGINSKEHDIRLKKQLESRPSAHGHRWQVLRSTV